MQMPPGVLTHKAIASVGVLRSRKGFISENERAFNVSISSEYRNKAYHSGICSKYTLSRTGVCQLFL